MNTTTRAEADYLLSQAEARRIAADNRVAVLIGDKERSERELAKAARNAGFRDVDLWQAAVRRPLRWNDGTHSRRPDVPVPPPPHLATIEEARRQLDAATAEVLRARKVAQQIEPTQTKPGLRDRIAGRPMTLLDVRYSKGDVVPAGVLDVLPHHRLVQLEGMGFLR